MNIRCKYKNYRYILTYKMLIFSINTATLEQGTIIIPILQMGKLNHIRKGKQLKRFYVQQHSQSCLTFCNPMDCSQPGSSVHGDSPGKNTGVGCHSLLQGIFLNQGLNLGLLHCKQIVYQLSHRPLYQNYDYYCGSENLRYY